MSDSAEHNVSEPWRAALLAADATMQQAILSLDQSALQIVMVAADPKEYRELAKVKPLDGKCWNLPVVSDGKLFARSTKEIVCLDVRKQ